MRSLCLTSLGLVAAMLALGPSTPAVAADKSKMNVLFIAVDDLRPELGCYGVPVVKSPNIDRLASQGLLFDRAYCQEAVCNPSRASLLTGLRPDTLKVYDLPTHFRDAKPDAITIPQWFKQQGYYTQRFGKIFHLTQGNRDDVFSWTVQANDRDWRQTPDSQPAADGSNPRERIARGKKADKKAPKIDHSNQLPYESVDIADAGLPDGMVADAAIRVLREVKDKPFFLAVGFYKPHLPFIAPKKYWDMYSADQIELAPNPFMPKEAPAYATNNAGELRAYKTMPKQGSIPPEEARKLKHGYYACVSYMDAQVGRVLDELNKLGLRDNTVVILWGDHGWQLGEHDTWCKHTAWEIATRAPLIISVPGQKNAGAKTQALVEFVDIFPSLVDVCGLPMPAKLDGTSFRPLLEDPKQPWKKAAFSLWPKKIPGHGDGFGRAIRTDRYRLVEWAVTGGEVVDYELYDHQSDPQENTSLAKRPEYKQLVEELAKQLHAGWEAAKPGTR